MELGEEDGVIALLDDGGDAGDCISCSNSRAEDISERSAMIIGGESYVIRDDLRDGRPVLERPLWVQASLTPGNDGGLLVGHGIQVSEGTGNVFGVTLCVVEKIVWDVEAYGICEAFLRDNLANVGLEVNGICGAVSAET